MMTMKEAESLPIPEQYKSTPNIYRLARIINSTDCPDKIMAALPLILSDAIRNPEPRREELKSER